MKKSDITCEVVQDLLPLYEDGCCSEQSKKIVEEHLSECRDCREKGRLYVGKLPQMDEQEEADLKKIREGIRKINRWKVRGIVSLCLSLVLILIVLPAWNYVRGWGLTYANLKAAYTAFSFEKALVSGNYEKAYDYLDMEWNYENLLSADMEYLIEINGKKDGEIIEDHIQEIGEKGFDWYNGVCREKFMRNMRKLEEMDEMICTYSDFQILKQPWGWMVWFQVQTSSEQDFRMQLDIRPGGIVNFYSSVDYETYNYETGEMIVDEELEQIDLMLSRFYISPSINETVFEIIYEGTDYDPGILFTY